MEDDFRSSEMLVKAILSVVLMLIFAFFISNVWTFVISLLVVPIIVFGIFSIK